MARHAQWMWPLALTLAACQVVSPTALHADAPSATETSPVADAQSPDVFQLFALGDVAIQNVLTDSAAPGQGAARLFDGDAATAWSSAGYKPSTAWVAMRLASSVPIGAVRVKTGPLAEGTTYDVQVSIDGRTWKTVLTDQRNTTWGLEAKAMPAGTVGRHVRLFFRNTRMARLSVYEVTLQTAGSQSAWSPGRGFGRFDGTGMPAIPETPPTPFEPPSATPPAPTGSRQYWPDLLAIAPSSFYVDDKVPGKKLLRFPTAIGNAGPGHLQVRGKAVGDITEATQEIIDDAGNILDRKDVGTFELHPDHGHFHVSHVARYELRRGSHTGPLVQNGKKISFCMEDSIKIRDDAGDSRIPSCSPTMQGVTRGYADVYSANLPEQTFDMENLGSDVYAIVITLDPLQKFLETNRNNNVAWVTFRYDARAAKAYRLESYP